MTRDARREDLDRSCYQRGTTHRTHSQASLPGPWSSTMLSFTTRTTPTMKTTNPRTRYLLRRSALTAAAFLPAITAFTSSSSPAMLATVTGPLGLLQHSPPPPHLPLPSSEIFSQRTQQYQSSHGFLQQSPPEFFSRPFHIQQRQTRLFSSRRGYDWDPDEDRQPKEKNVLEKAADKVKSVIPEGAKKFLPSKWFRTDEEKRAAIERKRRQDEISGALDQTLKDAPLGVRLMGKAAGKIFSKVASGLAETMEEQSRQMEDLLQDALSFIVADGMASNVLGEPITVGMPFSQSSSTSIINGAKSVNIQASFEVAGSRSAGVATMVANGSGIQRLRVDVAGRSFEVDTRGGRPPSNIGSGGYVSGQKPPPKKGDIIDAEIIDAEYREK